MIHSQQKGKRGEREVAKLINKYLGTNVRRTPSSGGLSIKGDIIDINPDSIAFQFHFEIKNTKKLFIPKWWKQIYSDCGRKIPVNIFKMDGKFYSMLELKDWLDGLAEIEQLKDEISLLKQDKTRLERELSR